MKINIYYGGRGIIGDPSLYAVNKMMKVFEELNVKCERFDLHDMKNNITTLPQTLKDADGIILASTVEWHGVGGYIYNFLDACWLYGDKEKLSGIYMMPVILSTTYGERDAELDLTKAWVTLGGMIGQGITGYFPDVAELEGSESYNLLLEDTAENFYKTINKKKISMPVSTREISQKVSKTRPVFLTPQETEQLSEYISDENYVTKQKQDIRDLADLFKGKMKSDVVDGTPSVIGLLEKNFVPQPGINTRYKLVISDKNKSIAIRVDNGKMDCKEGDVSYPECTLSMKEEVLVAITDGHKTFQGGFMDGSIVVKGDFKNLRILDDMFPFMK